MRKPDATTATAIYFEDMGKIMANLAANKPGDPSTQAALYREAAHYFSCAARLRGEAVLPLSLKKQQRATYRNRTSSAK